MRTFISTKKIKSLVSVLLVLVLMFPAFVMGQVKGPADVLTKSRKNQKETSVKDKKLPPRLMQLRRAVERPQSIPSATNLIKPLPYKNSSRGALAVTESGATLYGNLIYSAAWDDLSEVGFHYINPNTGSYFPIATSEYLTGAGTVVDGIAYVSYSGMYTNELLTIVLDINSSTFLNVIEHDPSDYTSYAVNMSYNYVENEIYALVFDEDGLNYRLSKFNPETFSYVKVADIIIAEDIFAMAFDDKGTLYIMCSDGKVRTLDHTTGEVGEEICDTGFIPAYMQSACWSPKDKKILWAASNDNESYILAIDVNAGTTETLCTFNLYEEWTCLYTTDPMAEDGAPQAPTVALNLDAEGSTTGSITLEAPTATLAGDALTSGDLSLVVELNGSEIYNAQVEPGAVTTLSNQQFVEGFNTVRAYAVNSVGNGSPATQKIFAGEDTPEAVTNVNVTVNDDGSVTITWNAPTKGENDGYVDWDALTYTVKRGDETVATGLTETTFTDQVSGEMATYQWTVYAVSGDKISEPATSEKVLIGSSISLPYEHAFSSDDCLDLYTIVNDNSDDITWAYDRNKNSLLYSYSRTLDADDYAFTPPLQLTSGKMFLVEITPYCYMSSYPERIEVTLGTSTHPLYQTTIIPATVVDWSTPQVLSAYFDVPTSGDYYIGIHAISDADSFYLMVKDIKVTEGPNYETPKAISDVTITPGANGALTSTISFKAPSESFSGNALTEDVTVTAYRSNDNTVVGEVTVAPGANGTIVDNNAVNGVNTYTLVASNSAGEGDKYEISCFCGVDVPSYVTNVNFTTAGDNLSTEISWDAPVGENGGYINLDEIVYTIYVPTEDGEDFEAIKETSDLFCKVSVDDTELQAHEFYVSAKNAAGESLLSGGSVVLGTPYAMPFVEKITTASLVNSPWLLYYEDNNSYATWELGNIMENYNLPEPVVAPDGGMAVCYDFWEFADGSCGLLAPKISVEGATAPTLYFSMYHYTTAADINKLSVKVTTDDATYEEIFARQVNDVTENGWVEYQVSLDEYKDASWIGIMFDAYIAADGFVFLDYAIVENASANDVMVESVLVPSKVEIGEEAEFTASILNKGSNAASYNVEFYVNDELLTSITGTELASDEVEEYTAKYTPNVEDLGELDVKVVVTMTGATDEVAANNEATANVTVVQPRLRVVTDLDGEYDNDKLTLTWSAPVLSAEASVDDMEDYESFIIDKIGYYTIVDADNTETYGINGVNVPVPNGPKAWQVWAPAELGLTATEWLAHSGDKCLVAFSTVSGAANDWLISPEVVGGTELSFYAAIPTNQYGAESFEVLYSTSDTNIASFQLLEKETKGTLEWEEFVYTLPNDAKYFAIRYTSTDIFALLIDDISFVDASSSSDLTILGYNVYRDGYKQNDEVVTEAQFSYEIGVCGGISKFNVTVVYNEGESLYSNTFVHDGGGVEDINGLGVNVYGQDDFIKIENVAGRVVRVFAIDGRVICNIKSTDDNILIPAEVGAYIVNIDNIASCKVVVR